MFGNNALHPRTSINSMLPRPTKQGVIGPPKVQMPKTSGDGQSRMSEFMPKASLGVKLSPLPQFPVQHTEPTSLFHSKGGFNGVRKM
jgi:hypothetical protein